MEMKEFFIGFLRDFDFSFELNEETQTIKIVKINMNLENQTRKGLIEIIEEKTAALNDLSDEFNKLRAIGKNLAKENVQLKKDVESLKRQIRP